MNSAQTILLIQQQKIEKLKQLIENGKKAIKQQQIEVGGHKVIYVNFQQKQEIYRQFFNN